MVHAVCFNQTALEGNTYQSIIKFLNAKNTEKKAEVFNCLESFPDGTISKSFMNPKEVAGGIINCGVDMEMFLRLNLQPEEDNGKTYEELVEDLQAGTITIIDFIKKQKDIADEYRSWLETNNLPETEETANAFLDFHEEMMMNCQNVDNKFPIA